MYRTQGALVARVQQEASQLPSPATTLYGETVIRAALLTAFNDVFEDTFWKDHCKWQQVTLDGTTGTVTEDLSYIGKYTDIAAMFHQDSPYPIRELPRTMNGLTADTGATPLYRTPYNVHIAATPPTQPYPTIDTKKFQILPKSAIGIIGFWCRIHPGDFTNNDSYVVPFDEDALVYHAAAHVLGRKGDPTFQMYMGKHLGRVMQLRASEAALPIPRNTRDPAALIPNEWFTCGC